MSFHLQRSNAQSSPIQRPRFLSETDCHDIAQRLARFAKGGGDTNVNIVSLWLGNTRWARNRVTTTGDDRDDRIHVVRTLPQGAANRAGAITFNDVSDVALVAVARQAERLARMEADQPEADLAVRPGSPFQERDEPAVVPQLFYESTYQLDAGRRAAAVRQFVQSAAAAGMLSAGYLEVMAVSLAYITSWGYAKYYQYTWAQCSVTVRDPKGIGSGWAGADWPDWTKIDGEELTAIALDKCLKSRNPVAVEPGRYTTILEPQAVCDFIGLMMFSDAINRRDETTQLSAFHKPGTGDREPPNSGSFPIGYARLGEKVIDERMTISSDPMDPELGFPSFPNFFNNANELGTAYHQAIWIENGVLKNLSYDRRYAVDLLGRDTGLPNSGAFRIGVSGTTFSIEEMIATTKRGLLVTRLDRVAGPDSAALLCRGYTRDGLWLIENGKISKAVKNMVFVESILFALNNVQQLGVPQRVFHRSPYGRLGVWYMNPQPVIVPPCKVKDFSFTALSDAI